MAVGRTVREVVGKLRLGFKQAAAEVPAGFNRAVLTGGQETNGVLFAVDSVEQFRVAPRVALADAVQLGATEGSEVAVPAFARASQFAVSFAHRLDLRDEAFAEFRELTAFFRGGEHLAGEVVVLE